MALHDDGPGQKLIETIFVPRGAEERAVRRAVARTKSPVRVIAHGIGPRAAAAAVDEALGKGAFGTALGTGLCGLLSPAFLVGDALVYRDLVRDDSRTLELDRSLGDAVAARVRGSQTGVRAMDSATVVTSAIAKRTAAARFSAQAVDMESYALAERLASAGVALAVLRVGSDGVADDLPALDRALDGSGGIDGAALALAMAREPLRSVRLIRSALRALRALEAALGRVLTRP